MTKMFIQPSMLPEGILDGIPSHLAWVRATKSRQVGTAGCQHWDECRWGWRCKGYLPEKNFHWIQRFLLKLLYQPELPSLKMLWRNEQWGNIMRCKILKSLPDHCRQNRFGLHCREYILPFIRLSVYFITDHRYSTASLVT